MKTLRIFTVFLLLFTYTSTYAFQPVIDVLNNIQAAISAVENKVQSLKAVQQIRVMMQQIGELQNMYNQAVRTYNNIGNYAKTFKKYFDANYWKKRFDPRQFNWRDISMLNGQLGIERDRTSSIYQLNKRLFGKSYNNPGMFTRLDREVKETDAALARLSLRNMLRKASATARANENKAKVLEDDREKGAIELQKGLAESSNALENSTSNLKTGLEGMKSITTETKLKTAELDMRLNKAVADQAVGKAIILSSAQQNTNANVEIELIKEQNRILEEKNRQKNLEEAYNQ